MGVYYYYYYYYYYCYPFFTFQRFSCSMNHFWHQLHSIKILQLQFYNTAMFRFTHYYLSFYLCHIINLRVLNV